MVKFTNFLIYIHGYSNWTWKNFNKVGVKSKKQKFANELENTSKHRSF